MNMYVYLSGNTLWQDVDASLKPTYTACQRLPPLLKHTSITVEGLAWTGGGGMAVQDPTGDKLATGKQAAAMIWHEI